MGVLAFLTLEESLVLFASVLLDGVETIAKPEVIHALFYLMIVSVSLWCLVIRK